MTGHPLFPARNDVDPPPEVVTIHVTRAGEGFATRAFAPDELQTLEQLYELYGGGHYTLIARDETKITARVTYPLQGPSKPLNDGASVGGPAPAPAAALPPPAAAPGPGADFLVAVLQMMQHSQDNTNKLIFAMMQRDQEAQRRHIESMQALHDRSVASQGELTRAMLEARTSQSPDTSAEWFLRGQQHGERVAEKLGKLADRFKGGDDDEGAGLVDELGELLGPVFAGMGHYQQQQQQQPPGPAPGAPPPAPPPDPRPPDGGNGAGHEPAPVEGFRPQGQPIYEPEEEDLQP